MKKKQYQRPVIEKVDLRVTESVLTACKLSTAVLQPGHTESPKICTAGPVKCETTTGS